MPTLRERLDGLATGIGNYIRDSVLPRLEPAGGTTGQVLTKLSNTNYDTGWQTPSTGGAGAATLHLVVPQAVGTYLSASIGGINTGTIAQAANRLEFHPFIPARNMSIDELAIEVTTLIASSLAKVGIYSDSGGQPNALLRGSADLDCSTIGVKAAAIASLALVAGTTYWLAVHANSTQTIRGIPLSALLPLGMAASGGTYFTTRRATATYASGLPSTAPATTLTNAIAPMVRVKVAT